MLSVISREEKIVFEYELNKLSHEYRKCADDVVKSLIKEDITFLYAVLERPLEQETVKK